MVPLLVASAVFLDLLQFGVTVAMLATLTPVLGGILGFVINLGLTATFGVGHVFGLYMAVSQASSKLKTRIEARIIRKVLVRCLGKAVPVINNLPLWTITTALALREMRKAAANDSRAIRDDEEEEEFVENVRMEETDEALAYGEDEKGAPFAPVRFQEAGARTRIPLSFDGVRLRQNNKKAA